MVQIVMAGVKTGRSMIVRNVVFLAARVVVPVILLAGLASPGAKGADPHPAVVNATIDMKFQIVNPKWFDGTKLNVHYMNPPWEPNPEPVIQQDGASRIKVFPRDGQQFEVQITRAAKDGRLPELAPHFAANLCLVWSEKRPPEGTPPTAAYACEEKDPAGQCAARADDRGWLVGCTPAATPSRQGWGLIGAAHAQPVPAASWIVPSLQTLDRLRQTYLVGYTRFEITPVSPPAGADHAVVRVYVNGAELLVDGIAAENHPQAIEPTKNFTISFGVQTLNMDGRVAGCNRIEIAIAYFQGARRLLAHRVAQNYAALRELAGASVVRDNIRYDWKGTYFRPAQQPETTVLFASQSDLEHISKLRAKFDNAGLTYRGQKLRAVIRPPLGDPRYYGLGAAIVEESGQLRFVFSSQDARSLLTDLVARRNASGLGDVIGQDAWMSAYPRPNDRGSPGVCPAAPQ